MHILSAGRSDAQDPNHGHTWRLEPGLAMLNQIPYIEHIWLDGADLDPSDQMPARQRIDEYTAQIRRALPENHPRLVSWEVTGFTTVKTMWPGPLRYRELWRKGERGGWVQVEHTVEPFEPERRRGLSRL